MGRTAAAPAFRVALLLGLAAERAAAQGVNATQLGCKPLACCPETLPMGLGRGGNAQIKGPAAVDRAGIAAWMAEMQAMKKACQEAIGFDGSAFEVEELKWTQTAYISPQMHPYDRFFYDPTLGNGTNGAGYTVKKWLGDLNKRYGGIDKALIWPTYTQIGIDDRSTWELILSMPGGPEGIAAVVDELHEAGVKVLWPYHPWDHSTHGQERNNVTDYESMAELNKVTHADGFNGDTMSHIPKGFYDAAVDIYKPIAMEAEGGIPMFDLNYITLGWAEGWSAYEAGAVNNIPNVDKAKWVSNGKAMTNWCDRWSGDRGVNLAHAGGLEKNKTAELQVAYFNGLGYESWENVWGTWNGIIPRDGENIRRVATLLRYFGGKGYLQSSDWEPHSPDVLQMAEGVFGTRFPGEDGTTVYFLVNRKDRPIEAPQLDVSKADASAKWYDCWNGVPLRPSGGKLTFEIESHGFACAVGTAEAVTLDDGVAGPTADELRSEAPPVPTDLTTLLKIMATLTRTPITSFSGTFSYLNQTMVNAEEKTPLRAKNSALADETYVHGGDFHFVAAGVELEGNHLSGVDVQYPWETYPHREHSHEMYIGAMMVDTFPVTNAKYAEFLEASHYHPTDTMNFLKHSFEFEDGKRMVKPGWENKPVTYVGIEDARAYCKYHKKRLPHVYEWQYFAQGNDGRVYPWGNIDDLTRTPTVSNNWTNPGPEEVGKYPLGASPFGIQDLVRSVWQYTSEFQDIHTRSVILRGGSNYSPYRGRECRWIENDDGTPRNFGPTDTVTGDGGTPACWNSSVDGTLQMQRVNNNVPGSYDPQTGKNLSHPMGGSHWYFPPAFKLSSYNKYYLMGGSYERAGTVGFRCVADAVDDCGTDGKLCATVTTPPETVALGRETDWQVWAPGGPVQKKGGRLISAVSALDDSSATGGVVSLEGDLFTKFTYPGGQSQAAALFAGPANGFVVNAAAPKPGKSSTLRLYVGNAVDAQGQLTATVDGPETLVQHVTHSDTSTGCVSVRYEGGPLTVRYTAAEGTVCANPALCLRSVDTQTTFPVQGHYQMPTDALDWAHFGGYTHMEGIDNTPIDDHPLDKVGFMVDRMKGGLGVLNPTNTTGPGSMAWDIFHGNFSGAKAPGTPFGWTGGTPTESAVSAGSAFATRGGVRMTIPAATGRRKLTLFVGIQNCTARLIAQVPGQDIATLDFDSTRELGVPANLNGQDWLWQQLNHQRCITIYFEGELTVTFEAVSGSDDLLASMILWEAAILEAVKEEEGGVTLQALVGPALLFAQARAPAI